MKIKVDFSELQSVLGYSNTILSDKSVDDKLKNVIFLVTPDSVKLVGYSVFTFSRTELENVEIDDSIPDTGWQFQVKASELNKIVSSFSSLSRTEVSKLAFEDDGVRIKVTVHEEPIEDGNVKLEQDSNFILENAPILKNIDSDIHMAFPDDADMLTSGDLFLYLDSLFPIMNNDTANSMASKINFASDYVFVITSYMSAFMENKLPDAFKEVTITYSSANFLKRLCEGTDNMSVARIDKYICIQSGNTEAFMKFQKVKVNYKMYVEKRSKDMGIVIDRLYLKDVLKRMGNIMPDGKGYILEDETLQVVNNSFQQVIPLENIKGEVVGVDFNLSATIFDKILIGRDDVFSSDVFMYFVPTARGYILYTSDKTGAWFSATQLTRA